MAFPSFSFLWVGKQSSISKYDAIMARLIANLVWRTHAATSHLSAVAVNGSPTLRISKINHYEPVQSVGEMIA